VRWWPGPQGDQRAYDPLQGFWLGEEGAHDDDDCKRNGGEVVEFHGRGDRVSTREFDAGHGLRAKDDIDAGQPGDEGRLNRMAATDWITLAEAVEILAASNVHFTTGTIGGWARSGRLQSIKLGGRRFVRRGEVRALVNVPRRVRATDLQPGLFEDIDR
jgi:hypothetical protein